MFYVTFVLRNSLVFNFYKVENVLVKCEERRGGVSQVCLAGRLRP